MPRISIAELLAEKEAGLDLELMAGKTGLDRVVQVPRIQKPGLALAGYTKNLHPDRIQVLGSTELTYLDEIINQDPLRAEQNIARLCALEICCFIITKGQEAPALLLNAVEQCGIPLLRTHHFSSTFISLLTQYLEERLLPQTTVHGVLVDVLGVGVLLVGKSGIGKSECALDLVLRGHRLVADDIVEIRKRPPDMIYGGGSDIIKHHMEIRGLGIINIKDLFGISAVRDAKKIELVVELVEWNEEEEYDRLGVEELRYRILEVDVPMLRIPVRPGRNMTAIIEVAARNQLLKIQGHHSAREFQDRLNRAIADQQPPGVVAGGEEVE